MPHLTLQYTANLSSLDIPQTLRRINQSTFEAGLFGEDEIKTRAVALPEFLVGTAGKQRAFVHLSVAMSARGPAVEGAMAKALGDVLIDAVGKKPQFSTQVCVEVMHVDTTSYVKVELEP